MVDAITKADKEHWSSRSAFVFAAIGSAIGLGNIWRFPRICAENGGFAFLIAFAVALFTAGIPILILELSMGERSQRATPGAFRFVNKRFEWIGWSIVCVGFVITTYYAVIMSWCWSYIGYSITQPWNMPIDKGGFDPEGFFFGTFLSVSDGAKLPGGWGAFSWQIMGGAALSWLAVIACIWKGVETVSKVVYFTVLIPWALLFIFVFRGVTLDGAGAGLAYYLTPKGEWFDFLCKSQTWTQAYSQVFFSLSIGFGIMFAYGSFLKRETDIVKNAFIIGICDAMTAFVAGIAVFGCLGHLSMPTEYGTGAVVTDPATIAVISQAPEHPAGEGDVVHVYVDGAVYRKGKPIEAWMGNSLGIAFVAYPTLINKIPGGVILGPIFFAMLLLLAIDSAFSLVEASVKPLEDKFGWSHKRSMFSVCALGFVLGVPFMFQSGLYWFDTVDHFINQFGLPFACIAACIVFGHVYGADRIRTDLREHRENHLGAWWSVMIRYVCPVVLIALVGFEIYDRWKAPYENYGRWVDFYGGWLMLAGIIAVGGLLTLAPGKDAGEDSGE